MIIALVFSWPKRENENAFSINMKNKAITISLASFIRVLIGRVFAGA